ncbi:MAG: GntR family transcriptional regulator [Tissierellia bacterium]|nr:GntR family transcriptional regulator [Tissierellia bacterium]
MTGIISSTSTMAIYDDVKNRIISLELPPGSTLTEIGLSKHYSISRTPIRDVMRFLTHQHFLVHSHGSHRVAEMSIDDYKNIYQMREIYESLSIREAVLLGSRKDVPALEENINKQKKLAKEPYDLLEYLRLNREFHLRFALMSNNPYLINGLDNVYDLFYRYNIYSDFDHPYGFAISEHIRIYEYFIQGDLYRAVSTMSDHLANVYALILYRLAKKL